MLRSHAACAGMRGVFCGMVPACSRRVTLSGAPCHCAAFFIPLVFPGPRPGTGETATDPNRVEQLYLSYNALAKPLLAQGLSGQIFTQISDIECECSGLLTYDRLSKVNASVIAESNRELLSAAARLGLHPAPGSASATQPSSWQPGTPTVALATAIPSPKCKISRDTRCTQPAWTPTWNMSESTIIMP